jgi:hypothetical protein
LSDRDVSGLGRGQERRDVAQVGRDGLGDARVLDLDGDRVADSVVATVRSSLARFDR